MPGGPPTFKFPVGRKLRIEGCCSKEELAKPTEFDSEGQPCFIVGKDGNTTDLTVGRFAGLVSFTLNEIGIESIELGIYNSGVKNAEPFLASHSTASSSATSYLPLCPPLFLSAIVIVSWTHPPSLHQEKPHSLMRASES